MIAALVLAVVAGLARWRRGRVGAAWWCAGVVLGAAAPFTVVTAATAVGGDGLDDLHRTDRDVLQHELTAPLCGGLPLLRPTRVSVAGRDTDGRPRQIEVRCEIPVLRLAEWDLEAHCADGAWWVPGYLDISFGGTCDAPTGTT